MTTPGSYCDTDGCDQRPTHMLWGKNLCAFCCGKLGNARDAQPFVRESTEGEAALNSSYLAFDEWWKRNGMAGVVGAHEAAFRAGAEWQKASSDAQPTESVKSDGGEGILHTTLFTRLLSIQEGQPWIVSDAMRDLRYLRERDLCEVCPVNAREKLTTKGKRVIKAALSAAMRSVEAK